MDFTEHHEFEEVFFDVLYKCVKCGMRVYKKSTDDYTEDFCAIEVEPLLTDADITEAEETIESLKPYGI